MALNCPILKILVPKTILFNGGILKHDYTIFIVHILYLYEVNQQQKLPAVDSWCQGYKYGTAEFRHLNFFQLQREKNVVNSIVFMNAKIVQIL